MRRAGLIQSVILSALLEARKNLDYGTAGGKRYFRIRNADLRRDMVKYRDLALLARMRSPFE